jgi:hypothetical protein
MHRTIIIPADVTAAFAKTWPCAGFPDGFAIAATFDSRGDLVDLEAAADGLPYDTTQCDGSALLALLEDHQPART